MFVTPLWSSFASPFSRVIFPDVSKEKCLLCMNINLSIKPLRKRNSKLALLNANTTSSVDNEGEIDAILYTGGGMRCGVRDVLLFVVL